MTDTTVGHSPGLADGVAGYIREVRAELADLPAEDLDDLTAGMEADLTELAAECGGDIAGRLGSPGLYAAELRAAAGLPERVAGPAPRRRPLADALTNPRASFTMFSEQRPWMQSVTTFLVTLLPAWWVLRGYLAAWAVWGILGTNHGIWPQGLLEYVLVLLAIVGSVQLSRAWLRQWPGLRPLVVVGNAVAIFVAFLVISSGAASGEANIDPPAYSLPPGVSLDGAQLANIYAFDSDGKRMNGVRLFAENGRPLNAAHSSVDANGSPVGLDHRGNPMAVVRDSSGAPLLNVYPQMRFGPDPWQVSDPASPQSSVPRWTPPMSINPLVLDSTTTPVPPATTPATLTPAVTPRTPATAPSAKPKPPNPAAPTPSSGPSPSVTPSGG